MTDPTERCVRCGREFKSGDDVIYGPPGKGLVHVKCPDDRMVEIGPGYIHVSEAADWPDDVSLPKWLEK
jgi:hypothetical protein